LFAGEAVGTDGPSTQGNYLWIETPDWPKWERKLVCGPYVHHVACVHGKYLPILDEACKYIGNIERISFNNNNKITKRGKHKMSFEKVSTILKERDAKNTAALAYDCFNYESIAWLIKAGEELNIPVIVMLYPAMLEDIPAEPFAAMTKAMAKKAKIPVGLHLDHCESFETIMSTIKAGFTSVMYDGSKLPFEDNIRGTCEVVKAAHAFGVDVEAELGKVGIAANKGDFENPGYVHYCRAGIRIYRQNKSRFAGYRYRQRPWVLC